LLWPYDFAMETITVCQTVRLEVQP
jgi:hypothetical protein